MPMARTRTLSLSDLNSVTEGCARRTAEQARPPRRVGKLKANRFEGVRLRDVLIARVIAEGLPVCYVAEVVGRSEKTVYRRLAALGIDPPRRAAAAGRNPRR